MDAIPRSDGHASARQSVIGTPESHANLGRRPGDCACIVLPYAAKHVDIADVDASGHADPLIGERLPLLREQRIDAHRNEYGDNQTAEQSSWDE